MAGRPDPICTYRGKRSKLGLRPFADEADVIRMNKDILTFQKETGEGGLRLVSERPDVPEIKPIEKQFVNFMFLKVIPEWRRLPSDKKSELKAEFVKVFEEFRPDLLLFSYSLVGFDVLAYRHISRYAAGDDGDAVSNRARKLFRGDQQLPFGDQEDDVRRGSVG